jgi:prepilin-type N-terminal cleavage/methylation domain-containing protein
MSPRRANTEAGFSLVELLVVMLLMGIVASAITGVVVSTMRVERQQQQLQDVVDDGRIAIERVRQELRAVRRVYEGSDERAMRVWVDRNQSGTVEPEELLCFVVRDLSLPGAVEGQYELVRWNEPDDAEDPGECHPTATPGDNEQVLARTLTSPEAFVEYTPDVPEQIEEPPVREVTVRLMLEVAGAPGSGEVAVTGSVRLRNVP